MDKFQGSTDRFLAWFKDVGGEFRDDLLEIRDLRSRGAGRGIGTLSSPSPMISDLH
jgi:SET domain-containing protein 6